MTLHFARTTVAGPVAAAALCEALDDLPTPPLSTELHDRDDGSGVWEVGGHFAEAPDALVVAAFADEALVGAATAVPLVHEHGDFQAPFKRQGIDAATVFYLAESVLLPAWRGQGIGHAFFDAREAAGRRLSLAVAAFCAVVRPLDHPLRPEGYRPLDDFWRKRGYRPVEGMTTTFPWRDLGEAAETAKPMQFWSKAL